MSFLRSLFSGVSGLQNHQLMMDVIGNNIANINTIGFKESRATFSEAFAQTLRGATQPFGDNGGSNAIQVGLGMSVGTVDQLFTQGNIETTGAPTDLAIQGNSFFIVNQGGKSLYTRVGTFQLDANGRLVNPGTGAVLQGKLALQDGTVPAGTRLEDLRIALDQTSPAKATSTVKLSGNLNANGSVATADLSGNLDSSTAVGGSVAKTFSVTDDNGTPHTVTATLTKTAADTWSVALTDPAGTITGGTGTATFDPATGTLTACTPSSITLTPANGSPAVSIAITSEKLTQTAQPSTLAANLDVPAETTNASVTVFDSLGNRHTLTIKLTKTSAPNDWTWSASVPSPATITGGATGHISFNDDGSLRAFTYDDGSNALSIEPQGGASAMSVSLNPGTAGVFAGITQSEGSSTVSPREQDGYGAGTLSNISVDQNGRIQGTFTNGTILTLGQVMLADFNNPGGLVKAGDNMFDVSGNSGTAAIVSPGESSSSTIVAGALEQSNVDLAVEFTRMITAQRGFQSNARVITTSDQFLQEIVDLKR